MEQIEFPPDFSEFLKSLTDHGVEYLLVGGFAVALHGYPRATADMDVWIARRHENAVRLVAALRIEILTDIDGVEFRTCANRSLTTTIDGTQVPVISLPDLKANKRACGRPKDLDDLENLPSD